MYILQAETLKSILLILFFLSYPVLDGIAQRATENILVSVECQQKTIPEILFLIEQQIKMPFFYSVERMTSKKLDFKVKELNLGEALKELFSGTSLDYIIYRESEIIIGDEMCIRDRPDSYERIPPSGKVIFIIILSYKCRHLFWEESGDKCQKKEI